MNIVFEYIKYHWNAKGRHGIHSPFVYDLVDNCFKLKLSESDKNQIESFENILKNNHKLIEIQDFGAGSKKLGQKRKISSIYKMSSSKGKYGKFLFRLAKHFEFQNVLEFGTSLGTGTLHLHLGNPLAEINTIEACKETFLVAKENLNHIKSIHLINETFDSFLSQPNNIKFDFIFVDGHHDGDALLNYMESLKAFSHADTLFLLDDIRWSDSMFDAWNKIVSDENYHLTIDLFRMGIVVPRPQQQKEHFILKI